MSTELLLYITKYGYVSIFFLVFLQEIGAPNPIPNELVLLLSGYLTFIGVLKLPLVILTAFTADFMGTTLLHSIFYFFGTYFLQHKPRWLPFPTKIINKLSKRLSKRGIGSIYLFRLSPFIRGYTSVICGLLKIKHKAYLLIALITAIVWSAAYTITGRLLGIFCGNFIADLRHFKFVMLIIFLLMITIFLLSRWRGIAKANKRIGR